MGAWLQFSADLVEAGKQGKQIQFGKPTSSANRTYTGVGRIIYQKVTA